MKNKFKITTLTLGIFFTIFLTYLIISAWTEPTQSPPSGNVSIDIECIERSQHIDISHHSYSGYEIFYSPPCPSGYTWVSGGYWVSQTAQHTGFWRNSNRTACEAYQLTLNWIECKAYCCRIN